MYITFYRRPPNRINQTVTVDVNGGIILKCVLIKVVCVCVYVCVCVRERERERVYTLDLSGSWLDVFNRS